MLLTGALVSDPLSSTNVRPIPSNFSVLASRTTEIELPDEDDPMVFEEVGEVTDEVWADSNNPGSLIFATRIEMEAEEDFDDMVMANVWAYEGELNDVFRSGFAGFDVDVAFIAETGIDEGFSRAARTAESLLDVVGTGPANPSADTVAMFGDINGEEDAPWSAWFLVRTNAPGFQLKADHLGVFQAGEEDQDPFLFTTSGYAPVPVPAALPLLSVAMGAFGVFARRRSS